MEACGRVSKKEGLSSLWMEGVDCIGWDKGLTRLVPFFFVWWDASLKNHFITVSEGKGLVGG